MCIILFCQIRGATPVEAALLAGEEKTGIAIQQMVYELDAGTILAAKKFPF
jgi:methionyl-tRNA formyltransferase